MVIGSFNCNSIRARMHIMSKWLSDTRPDVLCLQETKVSDEIFPLDDIRSLGYEAVFRGEKSYNGVAILSLHEIESWTSGFDRSGADEGTRFIAAVINSVTVLNTYIPQGTSPESEKFQYKLGWFARFREYLEKNHSPGDRLLWTGDFNVAPEPIDVHDPKRLLGHVGYHPDEHRALENVRQWGFTDIFRIYREEGGQYTFWDYRVRDSVARGLGWRVDHIWGTETMAGLSEDAFIDMEPRYWEKPSDHTPILARFKV